MTTIPETKWEPNSEYDAIVEQANRYSQYKLYLSTLKEQERLNAPSPVFDLFFKIINKIKQSIKQQTK